VAIMNDATRLKVRQMFEAQLKSTVEVLFFHAQAAAGDEQYTDATREILTDLSTLADGRIVLRDLHILEHADLAQTYGIDKTPALVFLDGTGRDPGVRFFGAPVGYEFMALLEDLIDISQGQTRLSEAIRSQIKAIDQDVRIQVFSTAS